MAPPKMRTPPCTGGVAEDHYEAGRSSDRSIAGGTQARSDRALALRQNGSGVAPIGAAAHNHIDLPPSAEDPIAFLAELKGICKARRYSPYWVDHTFHDVFGRFPREITDRKVQASEASAQTIAWVDQRNSEYHARIECDVQQFELNGRRLLCGDLTPLSREQMSAIIRALTAAILRYDSESENDMSRTRDAFNRMVAPILGADLNEGGQP